MGRLYLTQDAMFWYRWMSHKHGGLVISKIDARAQLLAATDGSERVTLAHYQQAWREMLPEVSKLPGYDDR